MKHRKTQLAAAVGAALLVGGTAAQAQTTVQSGQPLQIQLYGQVNRALMFADNETASKWFFVDNQVSSSRFGIMGTAQIAPGLRAGARLETEIRSNRSNEVNFVSPTNGSAQGFTERWIDASLEGAWGRINLGQGSGAADDASTVDLSGTTVANGATIADLGGAIPFTAGGVSLGVGPSAVVDNLDFESRYDRAMYTTPVFGGFRVQVGAGQKDNVGEATEASVWYSGKLAGDLQAAIGWSRVNNGTATTDNRETVGGSISWLHTSGFNITGQYTQRDLDGVVGGREASHYTLKVGYKFGAHAISALWEHGEDQAAAGDKADAFNVAYVWNPIRWAEVYAGYTLFQLDRTGVSPDDITVLYLGTRVRF
jgi:predicted porin